MPSRNRQHRPACPHTACRALRRQSWRQSNTPSAAPARKLQAEIAAWQIFHKQAHLIAQQPYLQNRATAKQQRGWVTHSELCKVRDALPVESKDRLLLGMYSWIPPCRANLEACKIIMQAPTASQLAASAGNYIVLPPQGSTQPAYLHLRQFKTSRSFPGGIKTALPAVLVETLRASLAQQPRSYLLTQQLSPAKPHTRKGFSAWANKRLQKLLGNPDFNLQLLRHAYVTAALAAYDAAKLDPCDQAGKALCAKRPADIAHAMGHSVEQQRRNQFELAPSGRPRQVTAKLVREQARHSDAEPLVLELLE